MLRGKDQTFARDYNMKTLMQILLNEELSCSELAEKCGLSKPAVTKITAEMFELNLIMQGSKNDDLSANLGRKRVYLSVNPNFGMIAAIDFSTVTIKIQLCNMRGQVLQQRLIPDSEYLTPEILDNVCLEFQSMLSAPNTKNKELLALCVAASGMVDKTDGQVIVSSKFKGCADLDLRKFFSEKLNCIVEIKNDVNLALLGEHLFGNTQNFTDAIMLYVDSGIGGALMVDNKVILGEKGFAGEFGLIDVTTPTGRVPLDSICSINAMKATIRKIGRPACLAERFHFADVVKAFHQGDETVAKVVYDSAEVLSQVINNLAVSLDNHKAIICGRVRLLGLKYLQKIRDGANNCEIEFSRLEDDGIIGGAIHAAWNMAIDLVIDRR